VDVEAARAAGMGAVAVTWGAGEPALLSVAGPDAIVDDVAGLREVLLPGPHP
jgi:pyrophosphatase PpaX